MADVAQRWARLLRWLREQHGMNVEGDEFLVEGREAGGAERGLFAFRPCPPSTVLFTIPAKALINYHTLSTIYSAPKDGRALTAVQLTSLHLLLHKPNGDDDSLDSAYGPYISTMPRDFASHPLTWLDMSKDGVDGGMELLLLASLPPSARAALDKLADRFYRDWSAVHDYLCQNPTIAAMSSRSNFSVTCLQNQTLLMDYLWAWLNVNTRCIYYPVRHSCSDKDNLTLCPVLDFANHNENHSQIIPVINSRTPAPGSRKNPDDYMFISCADHSIERGQQLFLRYGGHANRTLFVEYGFVNYCEPDAVATGEFRGEVDVQDLIEDLFSNSPDGSWLKATLEDEGYWGEWTLDSTPLPAHPSYRLITALRLYHLVEMQPRRSSSTYNELVKPWRDTLRGRTERISEENERRWRNTLLNLCDSIVSRAQTALRDERISGAEGCIYSAERNVHTLWREELEVAKAVACSVHAGEEF